MLARMISGFLLSSGRVMWVAPIRVSSRTIGPPAEATTAVQPISVSPWAISMVPRSTPPVTSDGSTCSTTGTG